jgi:hypothetical protein
MIKITIIMGLEYKRDTMRWFVGRGRGNEEGKG